MKETRAFLKKIGMPEGDAYNLPTSEKRFSDGAQYRFEVPGIQGPKVMEALLEAIDKYGIALHRITQTKGIMMLTDNEIMEIGQYHFQFHGFRQVARYRYIGACAGYRDVPYQFCLIVASGARIAIA